jgi:3-deoxy-7-phosphoheptulonate synthase
MATNIGVTYLRAQLFKPRTSPNSFQGLGIEGVEVLNKLRLKYPDLKFVCEVCSESQFEIAKDTADIIQIGARNMQNFELLKYISANFDKNKHEAILLKRGFANTYKEWIEASKYLMQDQVTKDQILLCERGSRSFTSETGVNLDFVNALKAKLEGFKVIIDPSHGSKHSDYVLPLTKASLAMDFAGVIVEVHPRPLESVSDKDQAISIEECTKFFNELNQI